jgi:hypothetical protein
MYKVDGMNIKLTQAEAKYTILKLLGFEASYKHDVVISNHTVEFTDCKLGTKNEENTLEK